MVLFGNHRDAWTFGGMDPISGTVVMLETARAFSELMKTGWKPQRTIQFLSWDAEEFGIIGSTYHAEKYKTALQKNAVAYINSDMGAYGTNLYSTLTPSLSGILRQALKEVIDPISKTSVFDAWDKKEYLPGTGSDYTAFIHNLGIPVVHLEFNGPSGQYHSAYDSYYLIDKLLSQGGYYNYSIALTRIFSLVCLSLADDNLLSYDYAWYSQLLQQELKTLSDKIASKPEGALHIDLTPIKNALLDLETAGNAVKVEREDLQRQIAGESNDTTVKTTPFQLTLLDMIKEFNNRMVNAEKEFLLPTGLSEQGRPWYKHSMYAPGLNTGYGSISFPAVAQPFEDDYPVLADDQIPAL
jgi:N-acetylated-alpha-linked acidic dipeptidase